MTKLAPDKTVLLVVDVQEKLTAAMPEPMRSACVRNVERLLEGAIALGMPVHATEQYPEGLGPTVASVKERLGSSTPIAKRTFSAIDDAFAREAIERHRGHAFVVVGMEAHVCVRATARDLVPFATAVHVPIDATCSRDPENRRIAEKLLEREGVIVTSTEAVLFELIGSATHPQFKTISKLVR